MSGRHEYFKSLVADCQDVVDELNVEPQDKAMVMAALILSDSFNGIRKAVLTPNFVVDRRKEPTTY